LPEEDTLHHRAQPIVGHVNIALIAYPYASNLDEFDPLIYERGVSVVPIRDYERLDAYDAILLPGSKNTAASLRSLRENGLAVEVAHSAERGTPIVGVCGGMQLLGHRIHDPNHLEAGDIEGLGLLDVMTTLELDKTTRQRKVLWVHGGTVEGYEIHHGRTRTGPRVQAHLEEGLGWEQGNIRGVYLHGLFENTGYRDSFLRSLGWQGRAEDWRARIDSEIDRVATLIATSGWGQKIDAAGQ
jgi:adenosylcobyric acid synthase